MYIIEIKITVENKGKPTKTNTLFYSGIKGNVGGMTTDIKQAQKFLFKWMAQILAEKLKKFGETKVVQL